MVFPFFKMCKSKKKDANQVAEATSGFQCSSSLASSSSSVKSKKSAVSSYGSGGFVITDSAATLSHLLPNLSNSSGAAIKNSLVNIRESIIPDQPHIFDYREISAATNNLKMKHYSKSSSSVSWRCNIRDQDVVVFQRRFRRQIDMPEIIDRLSVICKSHHSSLVKLRGVSVHGSYIFLVYEYASGASLASCLRNPMNPQFTVLSNWMSRIGVASNIADGLYYIQKSTGLGLQFVHNHLKSSSIIISEPELSAKICHFGTSELCGEITERTQNPKDLKRSNSKLNKFEGTRGYMAPEFQSNGIITQKCDVYALGVVILELLSGKEPLKYIVNEDSGSYLRISMVETARKAVAAGGGGVREWIDRRMRDSYPMEVAEKLTRLAVECVSEEACHRPDMEKIVTVISHLFLESQNWVKGMNMPTDISHSMAPR